jgi:hypothetical protein
MPQNTRLELVVRSDLTRVDDLNTPASILAFAATVLLLNGSGLNQADRVWHDQRNLAASATENLDLSGSLVDSLGGPFVLTKLKLIVVQGLVSNANNVNVGGVTNGVAGVFGDAATDFAVARPGGLFIWAAPDATAAPVVAGTGDLLKVANSAGGTGVDYKIILAGVA